MWWDSWAQCLSEAVVHGQWSSERRHKYADMISVSPLLHSWLASAARKRIGPLGIASIGPGSTLDHYIFNIIHDIHDIHDIQTQNASLQKNDIAYHDIHG